MAHEIDALGTVSALRAISDANLTDAGLNYLLGAMVGLCPQVTHQALRSIEAQCAADAELRLRLFRGVR